MDWFDSVGTFGEWAGAVASIIGLAVSIFALRQSKKAEDVSARNREKIEQQERDFKAQERALQEKQQRAQEEYLRWKREIENRNQHRSIAASVSAWWAVFDKDGENEAWGIVVRNQGTSAGLIRNAVIEVSCKIKKKAIVLTTVPPGQYFVPSHREDEAWDFAVSIADLADYEPILTSPQFSVKRFCFEDSVDQKWEWSPARGLSERHEVWKPQGSYKPHLAG